MLTLTENATATVKTIAEQSETSGLRITAEGQTEESFAISTAEQAEADDQVIEQDGAQIYLDAKAADQLADKVLDAAVDESGNVQFGLDQQEQG